MGWYYDYKPYVPVAQRRRQAHARGREAAEEGPARLADRDRGPDHRHDLLGQGVVRQPGVLQRLREPPAARPDLRPQRLGRAPGDQAGQDHARSSAGRSSTRSRSPSRPCPTRTWKRVKSECAGQIGSLVELLQGKLSKSVMDVVTRHNDGPVPEARGDRDELLLPGLGRHVQACRRGDVRRRRAPRPRVPSCSSCSARSITSS